MLETIIKNSKTNREKIARACGVHHSTVAYWCEQGLPKRKADAARRAHYERTIAKLAGMKVAALRKQLKENGE